ncbi:hypothetical protein L917_02240 [Phytophthora nicotianae]|uniref:Uncharacterized protein n=1 Tax=Phytophthora nicotianae TaxID=4792 RepID=W2JNQ0_PHYNI|nr:hypothetical protein L916_02311 [Phytophthora nicotianae]ETM01132.1 hypothetical protein L917_02240 [Phytophthora nicotianae]
MWDSVIECEPEISAESLPVTGVGAIPAVVEPPVAAPKGEDFEDSWSTTAHQ